MDKHIVASTGTSTPEKTFFTPADGPAKDMESDNDEHSDFDAIAQEFFAVDGHTSRSLMPFPHDPFRESAPWKKYDDLSIKDRIEQMREAGKFPDFDLDIFEGITNGGGLTQADKRGFTEFLFWWALGGYSMAGITEANGMWKVGNGGMTGWARRTINDYSGGIIFDTEVTKIRQPRGSQPVRVHTKDGRIISAKDVISTMPL